MASLDRFHRQAAEILLSDRVRGALDLSREPKGLRDDYGRGALGQGALAAPADRGGRTVCDARLRRLGYPRRQLPRTPESPASPARQGDRSAGPRPGIPRPPGRDDRHLRRRVRPHAARQRQRRSRPLVARDVRPPGRRRLPAQPSLAQPTTAAQPPRATPAPPTTWPPRSSSASASAPATKSSPPAAAQSRSSEKAAAWSRCRVERVRGADAERSQREPRPPVVTTARERVAQTESRPARRSPPRAEAACHDHRT